MKLVKFKPLKTKDIKELQDLIKTEEFKCFVFAGLKTDGTVLNFVSESSTLELCGILAFLEKDIKNQIEI
jgi:hypothetical protein